MVRQMRGGVAAGVLTALVMAGVQPAEAQTGLKRWLFAEGSTGPALPFEEEILIGNPNGVQANVTLRFLRDDGSAPIVHNFAVAPNSRQGFNVEGLVGQLAGVALEVTSDVDIVAERSMYWGGGRFNFAPPAGAAARPIIDMRAGHNAAGVNAPSTTWSFAEGAAGGPVNFQTYVLVSNPSADPAVIKVKYLTNEGMEVFDGAAGVLAPGARQTFYANGALESTLGARPQFDFAIEVASENGVGVIAERAMYWGAGLAAGHAAVGVSPSSAWYFAEGVQGGGAGFDSYVLLYNPSTTESIDVQVNFYGAAGLLEPVMQTIAPRSRANVSAGAYGTLVNQAFSITALNPQGKPFVAERAVYWRGFREGSVTAGATAAALKWGFAEGQEGGFGQFQNPADPDRRLFTSYYQVLNNSDAPVTVRGVFYVEPDAAAGIAPGTGAETSIVVNARSRGTFSPSLLAGLHNRKFAAFFEANGPVVMERAMYWGDGIKAGHASGGTVLPDALAPLAAPTAPPPPTITSISPARGIPSGGSVVTITGTGIGLKDSGLGATEVFFGVTRTPLQNITVNNANSITVITPPSGRGMASVLLNTRGAALELTSAFEFFDPFAATGPPTGGGNQEGIAILVAARNPGAMFNSCRNHDYIYELVAELRIRTGTNRWGMNWKRGNVGDFSHDVVDYYNGPEGSIMRDHPNVRIIDTIFSHCGSNPGPAWQDVTALTREKGDRGAWTVQPICSSRYRSVTHVVNGVPTFVFPECQ